MDLIRKVIREEIKLIFEDTFDKEVWYHGTPDVRELEEDGGFTQRHIDIEYVDDIDEWNSIQDSMSEAREEGDDKEYHNLINKVGQLRKKSSIRKPIFVTDVYSVAKTYADPQRAFDFQNSVEKILKVHTKGDNGVTINAPGSRFRFIDIKNVKQGFVNAGVDGNKFDEVAAKLNYALGVKGGIKTNNIAALADWLGFDYVDVKGVLDSYNGGSTKSTVRMVLDPSDIEIIKNEGHDALYEFEQYINEVFNTINESDEQSPTFEWDIAKEKVDKSKIGVDTSKKAYKYLNWFLDKVKSLPKSIKLRLTKYVVMSLLFLLGATTINGIVSNRAPEISQNIAMAINASDEEVPNEEVPNEEVPNEEVTIKAPTTVSDSLVEFLKYEEGSVKDGGEPVLSAYDMGDGMITVGWGHAEKINDSNFRKGEKISYEKAKELFKEDVEGAKAGLDRLLGRWDEAGIKYEINQGMYDAMVSMIFNMGIGNFLKSDFIQLVKSGDYDEAASEILITNVSYPGHIPRREREKEMFASNIQTKKLAMNEVRRLVIKVLRENHNNTTIKNNDNSLSEFKDIIRESLNDEESKDVKEPIIAYHVSSAEFDKFDSSMAGSNLHMKSETDANGIFFTTDQWSIDWMKNNLNRSGKNAYVYGCNLKYKDPYTLNDFYSMINKSHGDEYGEILVGNSGEWNTFDRHTKEIIDDMLKLGKDSIVFDDFYVMFDSNQIEILDIL
jgi:lysozyme